MDGDLLMSPKRLICSLQSDDEYQSNSGQENLADSDAGCGMYDSDEIEDDDYDADLKTDTVSEESIASSPCILSENYNLHCEWDAQMSMTKQDSGMRKKGVKCDEFSDMQEAGTSVKSTLKYMRRSCLAEDRTRQYHNQIIHGHASASLEGDRVNGSLRPLDIADRQINAELRTSKPTEKMEFIVHSRLWRKAQGLLLLAVAVGVFCAGVTTYMGNLEASNMLVPT